VCLTASAAANGEKTPIDIADEYYGHEAQQDNPPLLRGADQHGR